MILFALNSYFIGTIAGIFTATSLLPQLIKVAKEKKADDISIPMLLVLFTGLAFWIWYGFLKNDWAVIITNIFSMLVNVVMIFFSVKYK